LKFGRTRAWLRRNVSGREFQFWRRYYAERPWCAEGSFHIPLAQLTSLFANANRGKNSPAYKMKDFLPFRRNVVQDADIDEQLLSGKW
jgi:hypothetical protein